MSTVLDFESLVDADSLGKSIGEKYREWDNYRSGWKEQCKELRNYVYATDTKTTANAILPWSNTTTTPKLAQIMDNLSANYFATLFPGVSWMRWEPANQEANDPRKKETVQSYMENKVRQSGFVSTCYELLNDWILTGNCFAMVEWVDDFYMSDQGFTQVYMGPRLKRISPYDIVFNPAAQTFGQTPKIIRSIMSLGEVKRMIDENPDNDQYRYVFDKMMHTRAGVRSHEGHIDKADGYVADGFSNIQLYHDSDNVEVLTFYGDIYDADSDTLQANRVITVIDRAYVLSNVENPSWNGKDPIFHNAWRVRPDNLYGMGPLDNLVGLQYRIDHLENLKADVFDQIAYPMVKIQGDVEDFDFAPGERIYTGEEGNVDYLRPDVTALNADMQISQLELRMEEMAGAPKHAMGLRTPGEKTAFEVQNLSNASSRIFENKTAHFERSFLEPILNCMLVMARQNLDGVDSVRVMKGNAEIFRSVTRDDLISSGSLVPVGARHFAERARRIQNLTQLTQVKASDPTVGVHLSGENIARVLAEELSEPNLFSPNISVTEQLATQQAAQEAEVINQETLADQAERGL